MCLSPTLYPSDEDSDDRHKKVTTAIIVTMLQGDACWFQKCDVQSKFLFFVNSDIFFDFFVVLFGFVSMENLFEENLNVKKVIVEKLETN